MRNDSYDSLLNLIDSALSDYFDLAIPDIHWSDVIEILFIAFFIYQIIKWVKNTRAYTLIKGIGIIALIFIMAAIFQMNTILWLGEKFISVAFVAVVVVFQPELRNALEHLGRNNILTKLVPQVFKRAEAERLSDKTVNALVNACFDMGEVKTGALIVISREVSLEEYIRTGIRIDSVVSKQLIINIFEKNTPLHDGAVIIENDRIVAATCYLPLSTNTLISKELGTRHRAALGISEVSDSLTIIVSEETGHVSVAYGDRIERALTEEKLREILVTFQKPEVSEEEGGTDEKR